VDTGLETPDHEFLEGGDIMTNKCFFEELMAQKCFCDLIVMLGEHGHGHYHSSGVMMLH